METKNSDDFVMKKLQWMEYQSNFLVPPHAPGAGGLALLWKKEIEVEVLAFCQNFIDTRIKAKGKVFFVTFVYGERDRSKRLQVWNQLRDQAAERSEPWLLTGDFNDIIESSEKKGGPDRPEGSFTDLRSFMSAFDLYDLKFSGNFLSWRGQRYNHLVRCRLDRSMANSEWAENYPSGRSEYLRFEGSDHRPIVTSFEPVKKRQKGIFRYDRRLKDNEEVKKLLQEAWNAEINASVERRISHCRRAIIMWHKETQHNSQKKIEELRIKLEDAMTNLVQTSEQIEVINKELSSAYQEEEAFWKQRSRQLWLALGDKNTGYFHAATKGRKAINNISVIVDDQGQVVYEEEQIVKTISDYYQNLFTAEEGDRSTTVMEALRPCIPSELNETLISIPTPQEIEKASFSIHPDKAPGPDGFSASFFQSNWATVGEKLVSEVQKFFATGDLPQRINHTHVRLIPKITSPKTVADYRPIALCSVYYKIIAKLLSKRLQPVLNNIISENQSAFVPQRAINDNVLITHETLHYLKTSEL